MIKSSIVQEKQIIQSWLYKIQKELECLPEGTLYCSKNGQYFKWFQKIGNEQTYIHKSRREFAIQLAKKKYLIALQNDLLHEINCLDFYLNNHTDDWNSQKYLIEDSNYYHLLSQVFQPHSQELELWTKEPYNRNPNSTEQCIYRTASGILVRSKSELLIDTVLFLHKLPFRYEAELIIGNKTYYPKFTIRHPETGQFFYYEHFDQIDESEYSVLAFNQLEHYIAHGIIPGVNLITTYATQKYPLTFERIEKIIAFYFGTALFT